MSASGSRTTPTVGACVAGCEAGRSRLAPGPGRVGILVACLTVRPGNRDPASSSQRPAPWGFGCGRCSSVSSGVAGSTSRTTSFSIYTTAPCSRAVQDVARGHGLVEEQEPMMLLQDPRDLDVAARRSDAVLSRLAPDEMARHVDVWARGFGVPAPFLDPWLGSDLLARPEVVVCQASVDGVDVATALGIVADGFVGVFNVACVESHRRRGYGTALTVPARS